MGRAKDEWLEAEERGWSYPDTFVCGDCVLDEYLKQLVSDSLESRHCDYCGKTSEDDIAAPFSIVLDAVGETFMQYFAEPAASGLPRDTGEWLGEEAITDTQDALLAFGSFCEDEVFEEIANSFTNDSWYPCAGGHWSSLHPHEELGYAWESFVHEVKHVRRYFFARTARPTPYEPGETVHPLFLLRKIRDLIEGLDLTREIGAGAEVFRVREVEENERLSNLAEIGAPPNPKARAGRMNPAGISYCYLALERGTALAEVLKRPPCHAAVGHLRLQRPIRLIDLTGLPPEPSIFDPARREDREHILFLGKFVEAISQPIAKDGREHVDYVPSQIVSEYMAEDLESEAQRFDGVLFPSTVCKGGNNLVLFPPRGLLGSWDSILDVTHIEHVSYGNWTELMAALTA